MDKVIEHALKHGSGGKHAKPKHLKSFHAKEQSDGKYHVVRHSGNPAESANESTAENMNDVHAAMEDHLGTPNEGEAELGQGQPAVGTAPEAAAAMGQGQPGLS